MKRIDKGPTSRIIAFKYVCGYQRLYERHSSMIVNGNRFFTRNSDWEHVWFGNSPFDRFDIQMYLNEELFYTSFIQLKML